MVNFDAAPNKKAKLVLETSAFKQSRSDLNVAFSTADRETGILEFTVTQDNKPLLLGDENVKSDIVFIHSNGLKMKAPLVITDGLNGKISYQIPNDILATPGTVTSQVFVARKSNKETQAVVAERIFSFTIEKSLAWEFDAETKLNYIVEFDELEIELKQRAYAIEQAMSNLEDYVAKVEQAREKGLTDIEIAKTNSLEELNNLADTRLREIETTGTQYVNDLTTVRDGIDDKINQFNTDVSAGGYVKDTDTTNWQKSKMVADDGMVLTIDTIDFNNIDAKINKSGFYYAKSITNGPLGDYQKEGNITLLKYLNNKDRLTFQPRGTHKIFTKYKTGENNVWSEWYDLTYNMETTEGSQTKATQALIDAKTYIDEQVYDTGWQPLTVMSNVSKHDSAGASMYRVINNICEIRFNIGIDTWINQLPIIQPPTNAKPTSSFSFLARTTGSTGKNPAIISYDSAKGYFKVWTNGDNTINSGDYIYGHVVYMVGGTLNV
ncbi:BppU family phage baseplate upper protein [Mammaliicoccus sciuri]|uniref:BppU family phage baseplate upper protein n=1 Tax=Mammaliicoccus sciuri TaxID=1296 RepID=UPI00288467DA|nr:BppU family phage baseplate upper protein [Mammaliicoccus sciuri]MDT0703899.1 BppU family phage baseplate upper protein [Mammaliicoccus sciuri]